jgi:hypothetical protein
VTDEPPDYNTAPLPADATSTTEELEHYNTQPTPDPGNVVGGINLKDKSLAGVKTPRIYDAFSLRELALKSKYKRLKLLDPAYVGETRNFGQQKQPGELPGGQAHGFNTKYLKEEGREKFRLTIEKGELSQTSQVAKPDQLPLPVVKQRGEKFRTTGMDPVGSAFAENATVSYDTALFVMDPMGGLFAAPQRMSRFHHSSLLAGGPVACAGLMKVEGGRLTTIDNNSGHYKPEPENLLQVMDELSERGLMPNAYHVNVSYLDFKNTLRTQNFPPDNTPEAFYLVGKANQLETILPGYRPGPEPLAATAALMHHYGVHKNQPAAPA